MLFLAALLASTSVDLKLICQGVGDHAVHHEDDASAVTSSGQWVQGRASSSQQVQFEDRLDVEISGNSGKVRVPRRFLPPAHGGQGGWFTLADLTTTEDEITASVGINFMNHPKLRIDRRDGSINLDGKSGSFSGTCRPYEAGAGHAF